MGRQSDTQGVGLGRAGGDGAVWLQQRDVKGYWQLPGGKRGQQEGEESSPEGAGLG